MVHDSCDFCGGDCFIADIQVFIGCWGYFVSAVLWEFRILGPPDPAGQTSCVNIYHPQNVDIKSPQAEPHNRAK